MIQSEFLLYIACIIGGGVSSKSEQYMKYIDIRTDVVVAQLFNEAGIVGAAFTVPYLRKRNLL